MQSVEKSEEEFYTKLLSCRPTIVFSLHHNKVHVSKTQSLQRQNGSQYSPLWIILRSELLSIENYLTKKIVENKLFLS